jgi:hypothetical protein
VRHRHWPHHAASYYPLEFWDFNDDSIPDPSVTFWAVGSGWSAAELDRVGEATWQWRNYSVFDPTLDRSNANQLPLSTTPHRRSWVDGTYSSVCGDFPHGGVLAYVCIESHAPRLYPGTSIAYYRLLKVGMYFNDSPAYAWYYGTGTTPDQYADFKGVAAHEGGHLALLVHVPFDACDYPGPDMFTMCEGYSADSVEIDTMRMRSIEPDDIASATVIY